MLLRYFNPIGAHESGRIGEMPNGIPNNLMPYITQVAVGKLEKLHVFGNDYDTPDGTGVRDYIHVVDLAKGHVKALKAIEENCGVEVFNLGTGVGYSVLDMVKAFEAANGLEIPYVIEGRRAGDIDACYSDPTKAYEELGWKAEWDGEQSWELRRCAGTAGTGRRITPTGLTRKKTQKTSGWKRAARCCVRTDSAGGLFLFGNLPKWGQIAFRPPESPLPEA